MVSTGLTVLTAIVSVLSVDFALTNQTTPLASASDATTLPAKTNLAFPDQYGCFDCSRLERPACSPLLITCLKNLIEEPYKFEMNYKLKQGVSARPTNSAVRFKTTLLYASLRKTIAPEMAEVA